jgi:ribonuclease HI
MSVPAPHFLLYSQVSPASQDQARSLAGTSGRYTAGCWRFVLRQPGHDCELAAEDEEPEAGPERLELLAIVRGLEALDERCRVTLVAPSRYIQRGLEFGLTQWRENDWQWERYGRMTAVKNADLWQRLERLLEIHTVDCRAGRLNQADDLAAPPARQPLRDSGGRRLRIDPAEGKRTKSQRTQEPKEERLASLARFGSSVLRFFGHWLTPTAWQQ